MSRYSKGLSAAAGLAAALWAPALCAQYAPAPTTYSVTLSGGMGGAMVVYRDGSKAAINHPDAHSRTLYDLTTDTTYSWTPDHPENGCSAGTFSGDWGDPFASGDVDDLLKTASKPPASESWNGFATKVTEATDAKTNIEVKAWRETKYGLIVKAVMTQPGQPSMTLVEIAQFSTAKPDAALFALPAGCGPPPPTASQRFGAETGDDGANFVDRTMGPGSPNSCTMLLRFVRAGSLQPLSNFQVALDLNYDPNKPPHYTMGGSASGRSIFSGGNLKEYTAQIQNGVLRVDNIPAAFDLELTLAGGNQGASSALLYRKCSGPQTVLLYIVKNPDNVSEGSDWLWVKSGKLAAH